MAYIALFVLCRYTAHGHLYLTQHLYSEALLIQILSNLFVPPVEGVLYHDDLSKYFDRVRQEEHRFQVVSRIQLAYV